MHPTDAELARLTAEALEISDAAAALAQALDYAERTGADPRPHIAEWLRRATALDRLAAAHYEALDELEEDRAEQQRDAAEAAAQHPAD